MALVVTFMHHHEAFFSALDVERRLTRRADRLIVSWVLTAYWSRWQAQRAAYCRPASHRPGQRQQPRGQGKITVRSVGSCERFVRLLTSPSPLQTLPINLQQAAWIGYDTACQKGPRALINATVVYCGPVVNLTSNDKIIISLSARKQSCPT